MTDTRDTAAERLADYFRPGGFPGFTIDEGRAWTSQQVRDVLTHHREFLRQMIETSASAVLAEHQQMRDEIDALQGSSNRLQTRVTQLETERDETRQIADRLYRTLEAADDACTCMAVYAARAKARNEADAADAADRQHDAAATWTAPDGTVYDLTRDLTDRHGGRWRLARPTRDDTTPLLAHVHLDGDLADCHYQITTIHDQYGPFTQPENGAPA